VIFRFNVGLAHEAHRDRELELEGCGWNLGWDMIRAYWVGGI